MSTMNSHQVLIDIFGQFFQRIWSIGQGLVPDLKAATRPLIPLSRPSSDYVQPNRSQLKPIPRFYRPSSKPRIIEIINNLARLLSDQYRELRNLYCTFSTSSGREASDKISWIEEDFEREQNKITYKHNRKLFLMDQKRNRAEAEEKR